MKTKIGSIAIIMMLIVVNFSILFTASVGAAGIQPEWPTSWVELDTDPVEHVEKSFRDVNKAYYNLNHDYLYFKLECYGYPNFALHPDSRYKWYIDIDDPHNMVWSGGNVYEAEYLLFIEDTDNDGDGEIYLINDRNSDGNFKEWERPPNYWYEKLISDVNIANYSIDGNNVFLWIKLDNIGDPENAYFTWSTDNENSNVDQASTLDRSDIFEADLSKADIGIEKDDNIDPIAPGELLTYTLNVTNHGPHNAVNVNVTDVLPSEVTFSNANPASTGNNGSIYWWTYSSLNLGESIVITIDVTVGGIGIITNNASAYSDTHDFILGNNNCSQDTLIAIGTMYNLVINIEGNGSVSKSPDMTTYPSGTSVELSANGAPGWSFDHWSGDLNGSINPQIILMDDNKTVTANFTEDQYTLTINTIGNGNVTIDPDQTTYLYGTIVNLTANPDSGCILSYWSGDLSGSDIQESIVMDSDKSITAYFVEVYTLNVVVNGIGLVVKNPNQPYYTYGTEVQVNAVAGSGYIFDHWSGDLTGKINPSIINMTEDKSVTAYFVQSSSGGGSSGGGSGGGIPPVYLNPTANAGGPYFGTVGETVEFDGSQSTDNDEGGSSIVSYDWKFFDEDDWHTNIGAVTTYVYSEPGIYNISLRVYDNEASFDIDTTTVTISQLNSPPQGLTVEGENKGHQNTSYTYNISAIDPDGDNISYYVDWGDGSTSTSGALPGNTVYSADHIWTTYGHYIMTVSAVDDFGSESAVNFEVLIDIHYVKDIGYLIDTDSDSVYDSFFSNSTGNVTSSSRQSDGTYLINDDDDSAWDWVYDPIDDTLVPYKDKKSKADDNILWYLLILLILIIVALILFLLKRKKDKKEESSGSESQASPKN